MELVLQVEDLGQPEEAGVGAGPVEVHEELGHLGLPPGVDLGGLHAGDGVLDRRLADAHGLEAAFECRVLLDPAVLTERGRTDEVQLTAREFELLAYLARHPDQVLSREQILNAVWGFDFDPGTKVLEVYIGYLRRKLGQDGEGPIETVRNVGYRLRAPRG